jgi:NADH-quinone oxidoreductase subunit N
MIAIIIFACLAVSWIFAELLNLRLMFVLLTIAGIAASIVSEFQPVYPFTQLLGYYPGMTAFKLLIMVFAGLAVLFNAFSRKQHAHVQALTLFSALGALVLLSSSHLIVLFLALEMMSIPLYALAGSDKNTKSSQEAALKYFILGAFASAVILFGMALIYAGTGSLSLPYHLNVVVSPPLVYLASLFLLAGLAFKIGAVPFHAWVPDVYQGTPTPHTFLMSTMIKIAGFGLVYVVLAALLPLSYLWAIPLSLIAFFSLFLGNIMALKQTSLKRLFAYSSIAHVGTMLLCFLPFTGTTLFSLVVYLISYVLASGLLYFLIYMIETHYGSDSSTHLAGVAFSSPFFAVLFVGSLLSLAGIPPLLGFFGKYMVLVHLFQNNQWGPVLMASVGFVIGFWLYAKLVLLCFDSQTSRTPFSFTLAQKLFGLILFGLIIGLGIAPNLIRLLVQL